MRTWDAYHREMSGIAAEMIGAAGALEDFNDPDETAATAAAFRQFAARFRAVEVPK